MQDALQRYPNTTEYSRPRGMSTLAAHFVKPQDARAAKCVLHQLISLVRSRQLAFLWFDKEREALHAGEPVDCPATPHQACP